MSIQDLGALGEIIGGIAVIVTLVYLAIQTRQSRIAAEQTAKFAELQATRAVMDGYTNARSLWLSNPAVTEALAKANANEVLSESEKIQLSVVFEDLFVASAFAYLSSRASATRHASTADTNYLVLLFEENPGLLHEWHRIESIVRDVSGEFVDKVNKQMEAK